MLRPRPCTGSPIVVPDSVVLGRLSRPSGAQPSNPWTITGSVPFFAFVEPPSASSGCWASACMQEEPLSLCVEQEGDQELPCLFCAALTHPFCSEGGVLPSLRVQVHVAGSRLGCRKSPRASTRSKRAIRSSPVFLVRPSRILFVRKEGWSMPGYPRWARAVTSPVSCYWVSPSGGPCPIR